MFRSLNSRYIHLTTVEGVGRVHAWIHEFVNRSAHGSAAHSAGENAVLCSRVCLVPEDTWSLQVQFRKQEGMHSTLKTGSRNPFLIYIFPSPS